MARERKLGRPPGVDGADTVSAILAEAERQFAMSGYARTTNKTIADACGLTTAALYHYFGTKRALYTAVSAHVYPPMLAAFEAKLAEASGIRARLRAVLDVSVELNRQRPSLAGFVMGGPVEARRHPELQPVVDHHFGQIEAALGKMVEDAKAAGELVGSIDTDEVVDMILSVMHGFAHHAYRAGSPDRHARVVHAFELLLEGQLLTDGKRQ